MKHRGRGGMERECMERGWGVKKIFPRHQRINNDGPGLTMDDVLRVDVGAPPGDLSEDGQREVRQRRGGRVIEEDPPLERVQEGPAVAELLRGEWAGRWDALTLSNQSSATSRRRRDS